jgi:hypothetical protein
MRAAMLNGEPLAEDAPPGRPLRWHSHVLSLLIALIAGAYLCPLWMKSNAWLPVWVRQLQNRIHGSAVSTLNAGIKALGGQPLTTRWMWALLSVLMGVVVPWLFMLVMGRGRPRDIGLRWPNRVGWRLLAVGYLVALPLIGLMASAPATRAFYTSELKKFPLGTLAGTYLIVMVAEHFMYQGVLLALLRPGQRWPVIPEPAPVVGSVGVRSLRWIGLCQPTFGKAGLERVLAWVGLPEGCLGAMVLQAVLFGLGHVGKAPVEVLLSFPGGVGLAYVAYRCNSLLVPLILHLATGLTALGFVYLG